MWQRNGKEVHLAGVGIELGAQLGGDMVKEVSQTRPWGTLWGLEGSLGVFPKYNGEILDG